MEAKHCYMTSIVADLIAFEPLDHPQWRNDDTASTNRMIQEIIQNQKLWADLSQEFEVSKIDQIKEQIMSKYCEINTDPLKDDSSEEMNRKRKEMQNFRGVISLLELAGLCEENENENESASQQDFQASYSGLLEESLLRESNATLLKDVAKPNRTKPGVYSENMKIMTYKGKTYQYQHTENMENAVFVLLDRYNSLITASLGQKDEEVRTKNVFKTTAWLVVEFLHLHPFSDGNGRLCRLLCNYVVSTLGDPFPTPIYHIYDYSNGQCMRSESEDSPQPLPCRDDYLRAFVTARMEPKPAHPSEMAAMIIESNWRGWQEFMGKVESEINRK